MQGGFDSTCSRGDFGLNLCVDKVFVLAACGSWSVYSLSRNAIEMARQRSDQLSAAEPFRIGLKANIIT